MIRVIAQFNLSIHTLRLGVGMVVMSRSLYMLHSVIGS